MAQGIQEQSLTLPAIKPELHLLEVGGEMFRADLVPRSDDAALQERERRFNGVSVNVAINVMTSAVIDGLMALTSEASFVHRKRICGEVVGDNHFYFGTDVVFDVLRESSRLRIVRVEESQFAVTLTKADHDFFVSPPSATFTVSLSADIGFVHLNSTVQHWAVNFFHGCSDAMAEIPCGLVGAFVLAPDCPLELVGAHAFLRFAEQESCEKPLLQRQMGVVEDRASRDGELIVAVLAVEELFFRRKLDHWPLAADAFRAIRPTQTHKQFAASFVGVEQVYNVN